jgi:hypothetical protein
MSLEELKIRSANKELSTGEVIAQLPAEAKAFAYVVGAWVWIQFPERPSAATRKALGVLGFSWNQDRGVWQHPCGVYRCRNPRIDPREVYGIEVLDDQKN